MSISVLGISGRAGHGKDTVADMLGAKLLADGYKTKHYSFATPLKNIAKYVFELTDRDMNTQEGKKEISKYGYGLTNRTILQRIGTESFRNVFDDNIWIDIATRRVIDKKDSNEIVLIPDVRFDNEAKWVKKHGVLLEVVRPSIDNIEESSHQSEQGFKVPVDFTITNDGTLVDLEEFVNQLYEEHILGGLDV